MKNPLHLLAFDLGASNGRGILGRFDGERIELEELHRFENNFIGLGGMLYWDVLNLYQQMKLAFRAAKQFPEACRQTRMDIDRRITAAIQAWRTAQ